MKEKENKGVDLFEDYENIPDKVQKILDKHEEGIMDGDYAVLAEAKDELEKIGYTFEYYLDGVAYDLRKIGEMGKVEYAEKHYIGLMESGGEAQELVDLIKKHSLSVRKIPEQVTHVWTYSKGDENRKGSEVIERVIKENVSIEKFEEAKIKLSWSEKYGFRWEDGKVYRKFLKEVTIPKNAGWWMCKVSPRNTSSGDTWSYKTDNPSPTLEEAVKSCVEKISSESKMASGGNVGEDYSNLKGRKFISGWDKKEYSIHNVLFRDGEYVVQYISGDGDSEMYPSEFIPESMGRFEKGISVGDEEGVKGYFLLPSGSMASGGDVKTEKEIDEIANNLLKKLKEDGKTKRHVTYLGRKVFETIKPNKEKGAEGLYSRYHSADQHTLGVMQNWGLEEKEVLKIYKDSLREKYSGTPAMASGGTAKSKNTMNKFWNFFSGDGALISGGSYFDSGSSIMGAGGTAGDIISKKTGVWVGRMGYDVDSDKAFWNLLIGKSQDQYNDIVEVDGVKKRLSTWIKILSGKHGFEYPYYQKMSAGGTAGNKLLEFRWGRTNAVSLYVNDSRVATAGGGGYDKKGTALGEWMQKEFQEELKKLYAGKKKESDYYGMMKSDSDDKIFLDGATGFNSMENILNAIGYGLERVGSTKSVDKYILVENKRKDAGLNKQIKKAIDVLKNNGIISDKHHALDYDYSIEGNVLSFESSNTVDTAQDILDDANIPCEISGNKITIGDIMEKGGKIEKEIKVGDFAKVTDKKDPIYGYTGKVEDIEKNGNVRFFTVDAPKTAYRKKNAISVGQMEDVHISHLKWVDGELEKGGVADRKEIFTISATDSDNKDESVDRMPITTTTYYSEDKAEESAVKLKRQEPHLDVFINYGEYEVASGDIHGDINLTLPVDANGIVSNSVKS